MSKQPIPHNDENVLSKMDKILDKYFSVDEKKHPKAQTRFFYGGIIGVIILFAFVAGNSSSEKTFQVGDYEKIDYKWKTMSLNGIIENTNSPGLLMPRETETMKYTLTITNSEPEDRFYIVYTNVFHNGEFTQDEKDEPIKILAGDSKTIETFAVLENSGMNKISITIKPYGVRDDFAKGEIDYLNELDSEGFGHQIRTYTESDFNYHSERAFLYKWLWAIIAPFVILAIKHIRDIAEDRG